MKVGDPILIVVKGHYGVGLVEAVVSHVYQSRTRTREEVFVSSFNEGVAMPYAACDEGLTWTRGHDRSSPAA